jgi:hypothetical protein
MMLESKVDFRLDCFLLKDNLSDNNTRHQKNYSITRDKASVTEEEMISLASTVEPVVQPLVYYSLSWLLLSTTVEHLQSRS